MNKPIFKKVAVIFANSELSEHAVSKNSANNVFNSLKKQQYQPKMIEFSQNFVKDIKDFQPDVVFNCMHGTYGEDGAVCGILDILKIPYTHSNLLSSAICFNKIFTYELCELNNVKFPRYKAIYKEDILNGNTKGFEYPFFIKPNKEGSSIGAAIIYNQEEFKKYNYVGETFIIQDYIEGREIHSSILNGKFLGCMEIQPQYRKFFDFYSKYTKGATKYTLLEPSELTEKIQIMSQKVYNFCKCNSIVRMEFKINKNEEIFFLENNTNPGLSDISVCPQLAKVLGMSFDEVIEAILLTPATG